MASSPALVVAGPCPLRSRLEVAGCAALAAGASASVVLLLPRGGDLAAHVYRTALVQHGILVWDNLWFAGQYPLSAYSLLFYPLAAVTGITALGIGSAAAAAAFFASIAQRQWPVVYVWPARLFAVLVVGQVFTAAYPFDAGLAMLLATVWALQRRRVWLAALCTLLTLGFSPLAFLFLALALVAFFLARPRLGRQTLLIGVVATVAAGIQIGALELLPTPSLVYPFGTWKLLAGLAVAAAGVLLSVRSTAARPLAVIFVVWAACSLLAAFIPSPIGRNMLRASVLAVPLMIAAASLAGWRPRRLAIPAVVLALAANVLPYAAMVSYRSSDPSATAAFWQPAIDFLRSHNPPDFRVEVVRTPNHWENYFLPAAGLPLARGWYIQLDLADNRALYSPTLNAHAYRHWLRERAVRYVVLPRVEGEAGYGGREAALLASDRSGLRLVWHRPQATIYRLPHATPLLTGPARATLTRLDASHIDGHVGRAGRYLLRVTYNPYWTTTSGSVCLSPAGHGATWLHARRGGIFGLRAIESVPTLLDTILDDHSARCPQ